MFYSNIHTTQDTLDENFQSPNDSNQDPIR